MDIQPWRIIAWSFTLLVTVSAMWKGGRPERLSGLLFLIAAAWSWFAADHRWLTVQVQVLAIDTAMFVFLLLLAIRSDRWWPMFAGAFEGLCLLIHAAFAIQPKMMTVVYISGLNIAGYMVFASLGLGVVAHIRRQRQTARGPLSAP